MGHHDDRILRLHAAPVNPISTSPNGMYHIDSLQGSTATAVQARASLEHNGRLPMSHLPPRCTSIFCNGRVLVRFRRRRCLQISSAVLVFVIVDLEKNMVATTADLSNHFHCYASLLACADKTKQANATLEAAMRV